MVGQGLGQLTSYLQFPSEKSIYNCIVSDDVWACIYIYIYIYIYMNVEVNNGNRCCSKKEIEK